MSYRGNRQARLTIMQSTVSTSTKVIKLRYVKASAACTPNKRQDTPVQSTPKSAKSTSTLAKSTPTRGVAQEVSKSKKRAMAAVREVSPKAFVLSAFEDEQGRRRSARRANLIK